MTKRIHIRTIAVLLALVLGTAGTVCAQNEELDGIMYSVRAMKTNLERYYCPEYNIRVFCDAPDGDVVYLYRQDFYNQQLVDSAVFKKGKAVLTKKVPTKKGGDISKKYNASMLEALYHSLIPKGFYQLVYHGKSGFFPTWVYPFSVILNQQTTFDIQIKESDSDTSNAKANWEISWQERVIKNSEENSILMTTHFAEEQAMDAFDAVKAAAELTSTMPESFLGKYYHLNQEIMNSAQSDDPAVHFAFSAVPKENYHRVISQVDFTDARCCHSMSMLFLFIEEYLTSDNRESAAEIITEVDTILMRAARGGRYQCGLYAQWLYGIFDRTGDPYYEPVMLHIYDTYDRGWIPEDQERRIKRQMDRIRKLAPGAQIPELTAFDIDGKQHSINEIQTKYTILWFWDPDCDHCQEETPVLHDLYQKEADHLNFEVFAVEVNDDYDRWKAFSEKHGLGDWINLSTSMGETSVDYIEYFDIVTTPVILLIDNENNHTIIARQMTLDEIMRLMENK